MMRPLLMMLALAALALTACTPDAGAITVQGVALTEDDLLQGHILYTAWCAGCHGAKGEGQFPGAPLEPSPITNRIGAPPHDTTGHSWHHSDDLLVRYVIEGGFTDPAAFYPMPGFGWRLSVADARQIVGYIKTLWTDEQRMMQARTTEEEMALMAGQ
jgi:mono/diheme cytochrome c family protein